MTSRFEGKAALVTGAGSGIGRAVALRLASEGGRVLAVDIDAARVTETTAQAGEGVVAHTADISDPEACAAAVATAVAELGRLDVIANVAGILRMAHFVDHTYEQYRRVLAVNLDGPYFLTQAAIPHLLATSGNVVNVVSNSAIQGVPYSSAYGASKGGLLQLTRSLAVEFIKTPLRFNAVAPAGTNTNIAAGVDFPTDMDPDLAVRMAGTRALAEPADIAAVVAFLASDEARVVTGAVYTADNGITIS